MHRLAVVTLAQEAFQGIEACPLPIRRRGRAIIRDFSKPSTGRRTGLLICAIRHLLIAINGRRDLPWVLDRRYSGPVQSVALHGGRPGFDLDQDQPSRSEDEKINLVYAAVVIDELEIGPGPPYLVIREMAARKAQRRTPTRTRSGPRRSSAAPSCGWACPFKLFSSSRQSFRARSLPF